MIKVTLHDKKGYHTIEFVFHDMVEAGGFISTALRHTVAGELQAIVEEEIPAEFEILE
jgi:hypothetical protein